ncbi:MAG: HAMP domain-containing protein [Desulfobacteraceae bacterium]|nr:HAMP domain-containing protein [Desulfobacteraceae bacterium]
MKTKEFLFPNKKIHCYNTPLCIPKGIGIHFRLLLAAFMLISATTFALGYIGVNIIHQFVQSRFEERILFLARYLSLNAELGILIDERTMLNRLARNLLSEKDVVRVAILNNFGEILTDVSKRKALVNDHLSVVEVPVVLKESQEDSLVFQWKSDEELIGQVQITYSTESINRLLAILKARFIWLSAGLAVLSVLIFYFISRSLVSPITHLVQASRKVAKGDLKLRAIPSSLPETRELAEAFNAMLDSLEKSRIALDKANQDMIRQNTLAELGKFSLMIAHEVKNPLSIIKSSLDILKNDLDSKPEIMNSESEIPTMISYMDDEIKRLNRLIEDFLLFARPAVPCFRPVDANAMLDESLARMQTSGEDIEILASIPENPCHINADPDLLIRAINNILKNAFEANEQKGVIFVTASCQDSQELCSWWVVEVEDQGTGIDPEVIDRLFEPFFTTRSKGTGLGLAFASQVISAHRGSIIAENMSNGAMFRVKLPID